MKNRFLRTTTLFAAIVVGSTATSIPAFSQNRRQPGTTPAGASQPAPAATMPSGNAQTGNYRNERADALIPLEPEKRAAINTDLQATVVELLELYHDAKQSHWNLKGPLYFPLHEKLQEYADTYLSFADLLAERQLQIGMPADGRVSTIAQSANLAPFPAGPLADRQVLELMTERIFTIAKRVRARIDSSSKNGDEVTSNKFQDLSYELDKQVWQFRVHMQ